MAKVEEVAKVEKVAKVETVEKTAKVEEVAKVEKATTVEKAEETAEETAEAEFVARRPPRRQRSPATVAVAAAAVPRTSRLRAVLRMTLRPSPRCVHRAWPIPTHPTP